VAEAQSCFSRIAIGHCASAWRLLAGAKPQARGRRRAAVVGMSSDAWDAEASSRRRLFARIRASAAEPGRSSRRARRSRSGGRDRQILQAGWRNPEAPLELHDHAVLSVCGRSTSNARTSWSGWAGPGNATGRPEHRPADDASDQRRAGPREHLESARRLLPTAPDLPQPATVTLTFPIIPVSCERPPEGT
jgi:hypothetical protein